MKEDELAAILDSKGADQPCPFCRTNVWIAETTQKDTDELVEVAVVSKGEEQSDGNGRIMGIRQINHRGYLLTCEHCGFMRIHNKDVVKGSSHG